MEIKLPSGATATLKDAKDIKHRERKLIYVGIKDEWNVQERAYQMSDNLLAFATTAWSFDLIPPAVRRESLDELDVEDYDALSEAARPLMEAIFPKTFASPETEADPKAPTDS
jgi:galactose-1-phosphate uridylyltransferase